jgi:hypothetical protein
MRRCRAFDLAMDNAGAADWLMDLRLLGDRVSGTDMCTRHPACILLLSWLCTRMLCSSKSNGQRDGAADWLTDPRLLREGVSGAPHRTVLHVLTTTVLGIHPMCLNGQRQM